MKERNWIIKIDGLTSTIELIYTYSTLLERISFFSRMIAVTQKKSARWNYSTPAMPLHFHCLLYDHAGPILRMPAADRRDWKDALSPLSSQLLQPKAHSASVERSADIGEKITPHSADWLRARFWIQIFLLCIPY